MAVILIGSLLTDSASCRSTPIFFTCRRYWLLADVIDIPENADDNWILFNHDQSGYFRVNYDVALWDKITKQLLLNCKVGMCAMAVS